MSSRAPPKPPLCYRLVRDASGQSESIGVLLLLAVTVIGSVGIVAFGSTALDDTEDASANQRTEHTMTLFDSRAAMVALGDANSQTVDFSAGSGGSMEVREDTGWIRIVHLNHSGNDAREVIYNRSLGSLVYQRGDTEIAYQGGGVWRKSGGGTTMISPPEFHYRDATLTFPVIRVTGEGTASGDVQATVSSTDQFRRVFPNGTTTGGNGTGAPYNDTNNDGVHAPYVNPVRNGTVNVTVHSEYYEGWASYFRQRSEGDVTVYHDNATVEVQLVSIAEVGDFSMPADGNSIDVRGVSNAHSLDNFTVILRPDDVDSADFNNLQWSMTIEKGSTQMEIHLRNGNNNGCPSADPGHASVSVYYTEDGGSTYQGWHDDDAFDYQCDSDDNIYLVANLTSLNVDLTYTTLSNSDTAEYNPSGSLIDSASSPTWDEHESSVELEPVTFDSGETASMYNITNHYLALFNPNYEIEITDKNSNTVSEEDSKGTFDYDSTGGKFITFLHVTENEVEVEVH